MRGLLKKALTRKIARKGSRGKEQIIVISPSERLVVGVKFAVGMIGCLSAIEIAYMAFLGSWSSEVFACISGLIGTVSGVLIGQQV
jgi:hypothetical protein